MFESDPKHDSFLEFLTKRDSIEHVRRGAANILTMTSKVSRKNILLIIDPQRDFHEGGSLSITGNSLPKFSFSCCLLSQYRGYIDTEQDEIRPELENLAYLRT